ncbi:MAG: glycosyltransferase family 92 protein [Gemmatimonadales bacterium]
MLSQLSYRPDISGGILTPTRAADDPWAYIVAMSGVGGDLPAGERRRLSLMTVFLPRENLFFLEEWLRYHFAIGVDHCYLYDNSGSRWLDCGNSLEVTARNKRGEPIYRLLADRTDEEIAERLTALLAPFVRAGRVTHVRWQPRDQTGQITYGQAEAFLDYIRRFAAATDWVAFTDVDEFIVPVRHGHLVPILREVEVTGVTYLVLPQKCFASRFDDTGQPVGRVTAITRCAELVTAKLGRKAMIRADTLRIPWRKSNYSIHAPDVVERKTKRLLDPELIRFNHYKFNRWELDWAANHLGRAIELDQADSTLAGWAARLAALGPDSGGLGASFPGR